jgi:D-alanine transaminase
VTEGTSNNAYIVKGNRIITRALSPRHPARHHPRRRAALCREAQMEVEERNFTIAEAQAADEAFITSPRPL